MLANVGIPFAFENVIINILGLIAVVFIESGLIKLSLRTRYLKCLSTSAWANIASFLLGVIIGPLFLWGSAKYLFLAISFLLTLIVEFLILKAAFKNIRSSKIISATVTANVVTYVVVVVLIDILLMGTTRESRAGLKQRRTMIDMRTIGVAIGSYWIDHKRFPVYTGDWENELVGHNYYQGATKDAWGTPFRYISDGYSYTLVSYGKDQIPGGGESRFDSDIIYRDGEFVLEDNRFDKR